MGYYYGTILLFVTIMGDGKKRAKKKFLLVLHIVGPCSGVLVLPL